MFSSSHSLRGFKDMAQCRSPAWVFCCPCWCCGGPSDNSRQSKPSSLLQPELNSSKLVLHRALCWTVSSKIINQTYSTEILWLKKVINCRGTTPCFSLLCLMLRHQKKLGNSILTACLIPSKHISGFHSQGCVISTFEQHTMPSISDVKSVRMGANCSCCFCIGFITALLSSLSSLTAAKGDGGSAEWHLVELSFATQTSGALGMSVPKLRAASPSKAEQFHCLGLCLSW